MGGRAVRRLTVIETVCGVVIVAIAMMVCYTFLGSSPKGKVIEKVVVAKIEKKIEHSVKQNKKEEISKVDRRSETEVALNRLGFTLKNSVGVSVVKK